MSECTWCGHPAHDAGCPKTITAETPPERWPKIMPDKKKSTANRTVTCPCSRRVP